jgi:hypothetical protein
MRLALLALIAVALVGCSADTGEAQEESIGTAQAALRTHIGVVYDGTGYCDNYNCYIRNGTEGGVRQICTSACASQDRLANRTYASSPQCDYVSSTVQPVSTCSTGGPEPDPSEYTQWECDCYCLLNSGGGGTPPGTQQPNPAECIISPGSYCPAWCSRCTTTSTY